VNLSRILAVEAVCAAAAIDLRAPLQPSHAGQAALDLLRSAVPAPGPDRYLAPELAGAEQLVLNGDLLHAVEAVVGPLE
jgi:histidine ammonia-lyase